MDSKLVECAKNKLDEYGITIFKINQIEDNEFVIFTPNMVLFLRPSQNKISLSFQATTRPDDAAKLTLIINEIQIEDLEIDVMEVFIYNSDNDFFSGDSAYDLVQKTIENRAVEKYRQEETYEYLLKNVECHEC